MTPSADNDILAITKVPRIDLKPNALAYQLRDYRNHTCLGVCVYLHSKALLGLSVVRSKVSCACPKVRPEGITNGLLRARYNVHLGRLCAVRSETHNNLTVCLLAQLAVLAR